VLVIAFVVMPLVEIYAIVQVGQVIGAWWTIALLVVASIAGGWLIKREGGRAWRELVATIQAGRLPHRELADAALILVAGTLMLTPGFVTDVAGVLLVLPFTRPIARRALAAVMMRRFGLTATATSTTAFGAGPFGSPFGSGGRPAAGRDDVVQGTVVDD